MAIVRVAGRGLAVLTLVAACSPTTGSHAGAAPVLANPFRVGHTLVIAHGGGDGLFPEDTIYAYEHSVALGGEVIDVDVGLSADGVPVAFHDTVVDGTTDGHGRVADLTVAQLQQLDAAYSFTIAGKQPFRGMGLHIPTLREVLDRFPGMLVSLDLKDLGTDIIQPLCDVLRSTGSLARSFVGSNGDAQIVQIRRQCPDVRTSSNLPDARALWNAAATGDQTFRPAALIDQPPYQVNGQVLVTKERLAYAHAHGVAVLTWVVDDEATMRSLVAMGVDGIYTRYPDRLARVVTASPAPSST